MRSTYFKDRFQKERKVIEGQCVICHGDLDTLKKPLTYCKECGNNLHEHCKERWSRTSNTFPTCRTDWDETPLIRSANLDEVNADGYHVYAQWLYGCNIPTFAADKEDVWLRITRLVKSHALGEISNDIEFVQVVRKEIVKCSQEIGYVVTAAIQKAYEITEGPCALRKFFIELYLFGTYKCRIFSLTISKCSPISSCLCWKRLSIEIAEMSGKPWFEQDI